MYFQMMQFLGVFRPFLQRSLDKYTFHPSCPDNLVVHTFIHSLFMPAFILKQSLCNRPKGLIPPHTIAIPVEGSKPPIALETFMGKSSRFSSNIIVSEEAESSEPPIAIR